MEIEGKIIQIDLSGGQGHHWVNVDGPPVEQSDDLQEIAAEIIDGKVSACHDYVTRSGQHYRWG